MTQPPPFESLDLTPLHDATGGDPMFESELIIMYLDAAERTLRDIEDIEKDPGAWDELLLSFRNASTNIGAKRMASLSEEGLASGYSPDAAKTLLEKLSTEYAVIKNYLASLCG